jgi:hypothetical protein
MARLGSAGEAWSGVLGPGAVRCGEADKTRRSTVWLDEVDAERLGWSGMVRSGEAGRDEAGQHRPGLVGSGTVRCGSARFGLARQG